MSIVTYKSLFARWCFSLGEGKHGPPSKRQKYPAKGLPTVYMAYLFEDRNTAGRASAALSTYGVNIYADWSAAQLFNFDEKAAERLRYQLGLPGAWLVAIVSERSKDIDRLLWALELARETMPARHYAVLPVRYEDMDWHPPPAFAAYPRIEARSDDMVIVWPDSTYQLPLRRWFRPGD